MLHQKLYSCSTYNTLSHFVFGPSYDGIMVRKIINNRNWLCMHMNYQIQMLKTYDTKPWFHECQGS